MLIMLWHGYLTSCTTNSRRKRPPSRIKAPSFYRASKIQKRNFSIVLMNNEPQRHREHREKERKRENSKTWFTQQNWVGRVFSSAKIYPWELTLQFPQHTNSLPVVFDHPKPYPLALAPPLFGLSLGHQKDVQYPE